MRWNEQRVPATRAFHQALLDRGSDLLDRRRLGGLSAARGVGDGLRDLEDEGPVGAPLVRGLGVEDPARLGERGHRLPLDLVGRVGDAEAGATRFGEVAHELARLVVAGLTEVPGERTRLLERVEEAAVAERDEEPRAGHTPLQRLPFLLAEIGLRSHVPSLAAVS